MLNVDVMTGTDGVGSVVNIVMPHTRMLTLKLLSDITGMDQK